MNETQPPSTMITIDTNKSQLPDGDALVVSVSVEKDLVPNKDNTQHEAKTSQIKAKCDVNVVQTEARSPGVENGIGVPAASAAGNGDQNGTQHVIGDSLGCPSPETPLGNKEEEGKDLKCTTHPDTPACPIKSKISGESSSDTEAAQPPAVISEKEPGKVNGEACQSQDKTSLPSVSELTESQLLSDDTDTSTGGDALKHTSDSSSSHATNEHSGVCDASLLASDKEDVLILTECESESGRPREASPPPADSGAGGPSVLQTTSLNENVTDTEEATWTGVQGGPSPTPSTPAPAVPDKADNVDGMSVDNTATECPSLPKAQDTDVIAPSSQDMDVIAPSSQATDVIAPSSQDTDVIAPSSPSSEESTKDVDKMGSENSKPQEEKSTKETTSISFKNKQGNSVSVLQFHPELLQSETESAKPKEDDRQNMSEDNTNILAETADEIKKDSVNAEGGGQNLSSDSNVCAGETEMAPVIETVVGKEDALRMSETCSQVQPSDSVQPKEDCDILDEDHLLEGSSVSLDDINAGVDGKDLEDDIDMLEVEGGPVTRGDGGEEQPIVIESVQTQVEEMDQDEPALCTSPDEKVESMVTDDDVAVEDPAPGNQLDDVGATNESGDGVDPLRSEVDVECMNVESEEKMQSDEDVIQIDGNAPDVGEVSCVVDDGGCEKADNQGAGDDGLKDLVVISDDIKDKRVEKTPFDEVKVLDVEGNADVVSEDLITVDDGESEQLDVVGGGDTEQKDLVMVCEDMKDDVSLDSKNSDTDPTAKKDSENFTEGDSVSEEKIKSDPEVICVEVDEKDSQCKAENVNDEKKEEISEVYVEIVKSKEDQKVENENDNKSCDESKPIPEKVKFKDILKNKSEEENLDTNNSASTSSNEIAVDAQKNKVSKLSGVKNSSGNSGQESISTEAKNDLTHSTEDNTRKRNISQDEISVSSPKRSRVDSLNAKSEEGRKEVTSSEAEDVTVVLMDSDDEMKDDEKKKCSTLSEPKGAALNKLGMTLTSAALRGLIMASLKSVVHSHKAERARRLEERMMKMDSANSLWKESAKHLEKSVEELTKYSSEIEKRRNQSQKLKHLTNRSVGIQVFTGAPNAPLLQRSVPQQPPKPTQPQAPSQQSNLDSQPSKQISRQQQHRSATLSLPPSFLLNHNKQQQGQPAPVTQSGPSPQRAPNLPSGPQYPSPIRGPSPLDQNRPRAHRNPQNPPWHSQNPPQPHPQARPALGPMHRPNLPRPPVVNLIDLTDEDDTSRKTPNNAQFNTRTNNTPNQIHSQNSRVNPSQPNNNPRPSQNSAYRHEAQNNVSPAQVNHLKGGGSQAAAAAAASGQRAGAASRQASAAPQIPPGAQATKQPAPFPKERSLIVVPQTAKNMPPRPSLKISRVDKGIVLSWNMPATSNMEVVASYQLFAYQESSTYPNPAGWKKVGDVKALPLPMACTLTQFQEGNKYYFAVRAVDQFGRWGEYSEPSSIYLYPEGTNKKAGK